MRTICGNRVFSVLRTITWTTAIVALFGCSGSNSIGDNDPGIGGGGGGSGNAPTAQISPSGTLGVNEPVIVTFSESMNTDSLELGGSMATQAEVTWSATSADNDTLTLTAADGWNTGNQTLVIDAESAEGEALQTLDAEFTVVRDFGKFPAASIVIGQQDFASGNAHQGGTPDANTLDSPAGAIAFHSETGRLFVPDTAAARVLGFNDIPQANNANADFVIGQPDFTTTVADTGAASLRSPSAVTTQTGKLVVTDTDAHRVLVYDGIPASGPGSAAVVVGQVDMNARETGCSATSLNAPRAHFVTPDGKLLVADTGNNRVLIWNQLPAQNAQAPDLVLGQARFDTCVYNDEDQDGLFSPDWPPHANTLSAPTGIWSDGETLLVADTGNNRVLIWDEFPTESFAEADRLLGQNSFRTMAANDKDQNGETDADGAASASVLNHPTGVWSDGHQILVADRDNHRVLVWNAFPDHFFAPADAVLGQSNFEHNAANDRDQDDADNANPSETTLNQPTAVTVAGGYLWVTDTGNSRVLGFRSQ